MKKYLFIIVIYYLLIVLVRINADLGTKQFVLRFLDVGQGDAAYLKYNDVAIMIDAGPTGSMQKHISTYLFPFCELDMVFITHPHLDHFGGLSEIIKLCETQAFMFNDIDISTRAYTDLLDKIQNKYTNKKIIQPIYSQNKYQYGELTIIALWPSKLFIEKVSPNADLNQMSTVLFVDYKDFEALFTGDAEAETLADLDYTALEPFIDNGLDVLKVPHHGASAGLTSDILLQLQPKSCVISVGIGNKYGHPTDTTLSLLNDFGCNILRTDQLGTIEFSAD